MLPAQTLTETQLQDIIASITGREATYLYYMYILSLFLVSIVKPCVVLALLPLSSYPDVRGVSALPVPYRLS